VTTTSSNSVNGANMPEPHIEPEPHLERFDVVTTHAQSVYLRMALPPLTSRHLEQLPGYLRDLYQQRHR